MITTLKKTKHYPPPPHSNDSDDLIDSDLVNNNLASNSAYNLKTQNDIKKYELPNLTILLHSHACLEFKLDDFSLLCDPWISGYAFFGAWKHYPTPIIKAKDIKPSCIYISHEHSDHFHPQTLLCFDKEIPIFIPQFANGRLEKRLKDLGFKNIKSITFGERMQIYKECYITIYEPASIWNDSQSLLEFQGFRILNINDAGINYRIHNIIGQIDCICAAFSPGASGYPATYTHLSDIQKIDIYEKSRIATLDMLKDVCRLYNAKYFIPFASHFILNNPKHIEYMKLIRKNTIYDVIHSFKQENTKVIAMLAGDSYNVKDDRIFLLKRNENLYNADTIYEFIKQDFDRELFLEYYPDKNKYTFDREIAINYFSNLNKIPEMIFCEDLSVSVYPDSNKNLAFSFVIENGRLIVQDEIIEFANLTMQIPSEILMYICINNESWDEATIGYWCVFSRNPDIYHTEFWRILQTPYYLKKPAYNLRFDSNRINAASNIGDLLESLGSIAVKILSRYGLYCLDCNKAPMENIEAACLKHGIDSTRMQRMIKELNTHANDILN